MSVPNQAHVAPTPLAPLTGRRRDPWTRIPQLLTSFGGREREAAEASARRRSADARLLVLTGPGGVGKTCLALRVAVNLADDFADGGSFVALAPVIDPALVAPTREAQHMVELLALGQSLRIGPALRAIRHSSATGP